MLLKIFNTKLLPYILIFSLALLAFSSQYFGVSAKTNLNYQVYDQNNSRIHVVTVPTNHNYVVTPQAKAQLQPITDFAVENNGIAVINGGYFDPHNQKTTSYIIQQTNLVADPRTNERLIDNPDLQAYLGKILNRSEFRRYRCQGKNHYDITFHSTAIPDQCTLEDALGAGPQLLPQDTSVAEGFTAYEDSKLIRNAIGGDSLNARSAIAINSQGDLILAMVEQTKPSNSGMSLVDLAAFLQNLGATKAINLDGGSSASLYYGGKAYYGKLDQDNNKVQRLIKSVLIVR